MSTTYTFHVSGTHCKACKILIEDTLGEQAGVSAVNVDLGKQTVVVSGEMAGTPESLAAQWSTLLAPHKYALSLEKQQQPKDYKTLTYAIPLGIVILIAFFLLQRSGIVNIGFGGGLTPWTALLIGIIASVSSCLAVVGGLVLSLSAKVSQGASTKRPFLFFHIGRIGGFIILGGVLGAIGSALSISPSINAILGILVALVMVILGVNLLDVIHSAKRLQVSLPRHFFDRVTKIENGFFAPLIIGAGTFFLPCGFTQSMQLAALSSGSFGSGLLIMGMFALGTLPVLALLSFGSFRFAHSRYASMFFKTAGVVVIGLGVFALLSGFAALGWIAPVLNI